MLIQPGSALFTSPSQVEVASRMLFAPRGRVVNGARSFAAFLRREAPANPEKWQTRLMNGRPVDLLSLASTVDQEATLVGIKLFEDEIMESRRQLVALIYGFGEYWPEIAAEFEESEGRLDLRGVPHHSLFSPPTRIDGKEAGRRAFLSLVPRWQRAFGFLSPQWQERVRVSALGHRVSPEGELMVDTFTLYPETFFPLMGRLLFHLLLRHDGSPFPFKEVDPARWQLVGVTLDLMKRVLDLGERPYERGIDPFFQGVASYGETPFRRALSLVGREVSSSTTRLGLMLIHLRGEFSPYLPIDPLAFWEEPPMDLRDYFRTRLDLKALFEKPDLSEEDKSFLIAKGAAMYLDNYFDILVGIVLGRTHSQPRRRVHETLMRFDGRPFEMPYQGAFEGVFLEKESRVRWWLPKHLDGTLQLEGILQAFLKKLWEFLELLVDASRKSTVFAGWISSYLATRQYLDYEALSLEFAKEFVGAYHMIVFGSGNPTTSPSQMHPYLLEAEAIFMVYNGSSLFGEKSVFEDHVRSYIGKSPEGMLERMRQMVTGTTRPFSPPTPAP